MAPSDAILPVSTEGTVNGQEIRLRQPIPGLEGQRVRVVIEALRDEDATVSPDEHESLWQAWVSGGPQGPIETDEETFPPDSTAVTSDGP